MDFKKIPQTCPKCRNPYWDKPIKREKTSKLIKEIRKGEKEKNHLNL